MRRAVGEDREETLPLLLEVALRRAVLQLGQEAMPLVALRVGVGGSVVHDFHPFSRGGAFFSCLKGFSWENRREEGRNSED